MAWALYVVKFYRNSVKTAILIVAASLVATASPALAQNSGPYIGLGGGIALPSDTDVKGTGIDTSVDLKAAGLASIFGGHAFENGLRGEVEVSTRRASVDGVSGSTAGTGDVQVWNFMANVLYDFSLGEGFSPYLGAGLGYAVSDFDDVQPIGGSALADKGGALAYQGLAGVGYQLNDRFSLFADYRYLGLGDVDLRTNSSIDVETEYREHRVTFGVRFSFGGPKAKPRSEPKPQPIALPVADPKPEPKPAPAPPVAQSAPPPPEVTPPTKAVEPPRTYLVFFEWDKTALTSEGKDVLKVAATNSKKTKVTRIQADGHADRSGPDAYNLKLSQERAEHVRAELIKNGVPAGIITVVGKGETEPLIPTANGVREPQNRRVEIVLE